MPLDPNATKCAMQGAGEDKQCGYFALCNAMTVHNPHDRNASTPSGLLKHGGHADKEQLPGKLLNDVLKNTHSPYACTDSVHVGPALRADLSVVIGFARCVFNKAGMAPETNDHWLVITDWKRLESGGLVKETVRVMDSADGSISTQNIEPGANGLKFTRDLGGGTRVYTINFGCAIVPSDNAGIVPQDVKDVIANGIAFGTTKKSESSCAIQ